MARLSEQVTSARALRARVGSTKKSASARRAVARADRILARVDAGELYGTIGARKVASAERSYRNALDILKKQGGSAAGRKKKAPKAQAAFGF